MGKRHNRGSTRKAKNSYPIPAICLAGVLIMLLFAFSGGKSAEASEQTKAVKTETVAVVAAAAADKSQVETKSPEEKEPFNLEMVPVYSGSAYVDINGDIPFFSEDELTAEPFQEYWPLDELGRSTGAFACIGPELLPKENRSGNSSAIEPTGWHSVQYDGIDGGYLYNRCHLIGYQLTGHILSRTEV